MLVVEGGEILECLPSPTWGTSTFLFKRLITDDGEDLTSPHPLTTLRDEPFKRLF